MDEVLDPLFGSNDAAEALAKEQERLAEEQSKLEEENALKEEQLEKERIRGLQGARRTPGGSSTSLG